MRTFVWCSEFGVVCTEVTVQQQAGSPSLPHHSHTGKGKVALARIEIETHTQRKIAAQRRNDRISFE